MVIESTSITWAIVDLMARHAGRVVVSKPPGRFPAPVSVTPKRPLDKSGCRHLCWCSESQPAPTLQRGLPFGYWTLAAGRLAHIWRRMATTASAVPGESHSWFAWSECLGDRLADARNGRDSKAEAATSRLLHSLRNDNRRRGAAP